MNVQLLMKRYKNIIPYLFFGVCTTLVNVIVYWFCAHLMKYMVMASTVVAWTLAVLFAYVTNRKWVFHSEAKNTKEIIYELISFFGCRLATGIIDWSCMFVFVNIVGFDDVIIKTLANFLVIVLNYIASKRVIFVKGKE